MTLTLTIEAKHWPLREPFTISRGTQTGIDCLIVTLSDAAGRRGRGEGIGVNYAGETPASIAAQIGMV